MRLMAFALGMLTTGCLPGAFCNFEPVECSETRGIPGSYEGTLVTHAGESSPADVFIDPEQELVEVTWTDEAGNTWRATWPVTEVLEPDSS